jgi:hypothetical protein
VRGRVGSEERVAVAVGVGSPVAVPAAVHEHCLAGHVVGQQVGPVDGAIGGPRHVDGDRVEVGKPLERELGEVDAVGEAMKRAVDVGARLRAHVDAPDLKLRSGRVVRAALLAAEEVAHGRGRQAGVGDHPVLDDMAEIDPGPAVGGRGTELAASRALVALAKDPLVEDPHLPDHEQPQVAHDVGGQLVVVDVVAVDVEAKALPLDPPAVGEAHYEVELHAAIVVLDGGHATCLPV